MEQSRLGVVLSGTERFFDKDEIIVSKTDAKGIITYANDIFLSIADYDEKDVINKPHNIVRNPNMPRCIFKLLWDTIKAGKEIFAYVVNVGKKGDHYWVLAHVTPTMNTDGEIIGYHSNRRIVTKEAREKIEPLYKQLLAEENKHNTPKAGIEASYQMLTDILAKEGVSYDEFIFSL